MSGYFTESNYENAVLQLLNEELGYNYVYGPDVERDYHSPLYEDVLLSSLQRINKSLPMDALSEAVYKLKNFETGTLLQKNMVFMDYLQNGVPVKYYDKGEERSTLVYLVDFKNPASNEFTVANQWTFIENSEKRPDVILFVNGLPLVIVELKSPSREETDASAAYRQLRNYMYEIPSMFIYNAVCVMSDLTTSKAGTITSGEDRFMEWKTTDGSYENTQHASFDTFFVGLFEKTRFLDIVKNFICFNVDGQNTFKILAGYHQYFAVKKAIESTKHATVTDGKGGVFWHTQGSGKSLSMVFYVSLATLVKNYEPLTEGERQYARNPLTHVDFLLFNQMDKQPVLAIEVDGTGFHEARSKQEERDIKKNSILEKCAVPLLRLRTDGSGEKEKIRNALKRE